MSILKTSDPNSSEIVARALKQAFADGATLYVCGNGGAASDSNHFVGELNKSFIKPRQQKRQLSANNSWYHQLEFGYRAISLCANPATLTAIGNDQGFANVYAQQIYAFANKNDVLMAITTSGNSENIMRAISLATDLQLTVILITSNLQAKHNNIDYVAVTDATSVAQGQEEIICFLHKICENFEDE